MTRKKTIWIGIIFRTLWFLSAGFTMIFYLADKLPDSFQVPKFIGWLYEFIGVLPASIVQLVLCFFIIFFFVTKKNEKN
ncbi:hypothetical protein [Enterococcus sp. AZ101]|uniref:hypothetical protein n=1 Tax=unclassified Enterococcus TaxID=2608891 RepID=UPI003D2D364C